MSRDGIDIPPEPLWLDRQLAGRLTAFFRCSFSTLPGGFAMALRLWQWEKLCATVLTAVEGTLQYRSLGRKDALRMMRAALEIDRNKTEAGGTADLSLAGCRGLYPAHREKAVSALLEQLPCTLPEQLAEAPESFLAVSHSEVSGLISLPTSGTTGKGKRIFCTQGDLDETVAFFRHGMQYLVQPGTARGRQDHVALLMSGDRPGSVGDLLRRAMADLGVPCTVTGFLQPGPAGEEAMFDQLLALEPTCLVGVPGQLFSLARHSRARELAGQVRTVLLSGDTVTPPLREGISRGFNCKVHVHYGMTETGLGGAVECAERNGSHMREADLIHEILDPEGKSLPPGQWGEITITTLTRQAMPLLRYRTGDEGRILPEPCVCGSLFGRLTLRGRMSQRIPLDNGGCLHIMDIDSRLYRLPFVQGYSLTLHRTNRDGKNSCLVVKLRNTPDAPENARALAAEALSSLPLTRMIHSPEDLRADSPELPLLVRAFLHAQPGDSEEAPFRQQAKQTLRYSDEPVFNPV